MQVEFRRSRAGVAARDERSDCGHHGDDEKRSVDSLSGVVRTRWAHVRLRQSEWFVCREGRSTGAAQRKSGRDQGTERWRRSLDDQPRSERAEEVRRTCECGQSGGKVSKPEASKHVTLGLWSDLGEAFNNLRAQKTRTLLTAL